MGDGKVGDYINVEFVVEIPHSLIVNNSKELMKDIIQSFYSNVLQMLEMLNTLKIDQY